MYSLVQMKYADGTVPTFRILGDDTLSNFER